MTAVEREQQERLRAILRRMGVTNFEVLRKALALAKESARS